MQSDHRLKWLVDSLSKLIETEEVYYVVLDDTLEVVDLPEKTLRFLQAYYAVPDLQLLPDELMQTIRSHIQAANGLLQPDQTFSFKKYPKGGHFLCRGCPIVIGSKTTAILLKLIPFGPTEDFSFLTSIGLTAREAELLSFLPLGYPDKAIATAMDISHNGVKKHLNKIACKLNAKGRTEILYKALLKKREVMALALSVQPDLEAYQGVQ